MNLRGTGTRRALWPVDLRMILYRGDVAAQASAPRHEEPRAVKLTVASQPRMKRPWSRAVP